MKKLCFLFMLILGVMTLSVCSAFAANDISVNVNGSAIAFPDAKPFIDANGRTLIPVRFVSEALGADVLWNGELKEVQISLGTTIITMRIGNKTITVNGVEKQMDTEPTIAMDRTCVPVRFVAEGLGAEVIWNGETRTIDINMAPVSNGPNMLVQVDFIVNINVLKALDAQYTAAEKDLADNQVDANTITEILTYVKQKTKDNIKEPLPEKLWEWGNKTIKVVSNANSPYITISGK